MVRGSSARVVGEHEVVPLEAHLLDGLAHLGDELLGEGGLLGVDHRAAVAWLGVGAGSGLGFG